MSERRKTAKEIMILKEEIQQLEIKRSRSQSALLTALISRQQPDPDDVKFFTAFSSEIDFKREQLKKLISTLD